MPESSLSNARIQDWLAPDLDGRAALMAASKVDINSAVVWWFCHRLSDAERADVLAEFTRFTALRMPGANGKPDAGKRVKKPKAG